MIRLFILDFRSSSTRGRCKHGIIGAQQEGGVLPEVTFRYPDIPKTRSLLINHKQSCFLWFRQHRTFRTALLRYCFVVI